MSLKKNIIYNVLYQISTIMISLVTAPYIARVIGPKGVGIYSYSTSVASYFALFILFGIGNYGVRTIAKVRDDKNKRSRTFCELYAFQLICAVVVIAIYCLFVVGNDQPYKIALSVQILYLLSVALDINWYFAGTEQFKITVTRGMIIKFIQVALIFLLVKRPADLYVYITIMTGGVLLGQLLLLPVLFRQVKLQKVEIRNIIGHIKPNMILFIPILATSMFVIMDKIMLELINHDISAVGIYENSEKIVKLPLGVISAIGTVMLPKISNLLSKDNEELCIEYFGLSMKYIGVLVVAMAFGIAGIAPVFAIVFYGADFAECGYIITMLSIILVTSSWANIIRTQYLIPKEKEIVYSVAVVSGAVMNLVLNYIFIPKYGAMGAALGTIGAEVTLCVIHTVGVWKELPILKKTIIDWACYIAEGIIMFIIVRMIGNVMGVHVYTLAVQIIAGGIFYIICTLLLLIAKKDSLAIELIKRIKRYGG